MSYICPGADVRDARHQCVDIAADAIEIRHLASDPCRRELLGAAGEMDEALAEQTRVAVAQNLAEIGYLTHFPQHADRAGMNGELCNFRFAREYLQSAVIVSLTRPNQSGNGRPLVEALQQCSNRFEAEPRVAPIQPRQRIKAVGLDRLDDLRIKRTLLRGGAKGSVAHVSTRAPGNLCDLGGIQSAGASAIKFVDSGKGDMVEIHVEPHADRVRRNKVIDLAGLKHADLRIACAGAERPENNRGPAARAPHDLSKGKYISHGECYDGAARRQPCHLLIASVGERRKTRPAHVLDFAHQPPHQWFYRICA